MRRSALGTDRRQSPGTGTGTAWLRSCSLGRGAAAGPPPAAAAAAAASMPAVSNCETALAVAMGTPWRCGPPLPPSHFTSFTAVKKNRTRTVDRIGPYYTLCNITVLEKINKAAGGVKQVKETSGPLAGARKYGGWNTRRKSRVFFFLFTLLWLWTNGRKGKKKKGRSLAIGSTTVTNNPSGILVIRTHRFRLGAGGPLKRKGWWVVGEEVEAGRRWNPRQPGHATDHTLVSSRSCVCGCGLDTGETASCSLAIRLGSGPSQAMISSPAPAAFRSALPAPCPYGSTSISTS